MNKHTLQETDHFHIYLDQLLSPFIRVSRLIGNLALAKDAVH